jgi:DNA-binding transcriptional regulator PaaX
MSMKLVSAVLESSLPSADRLVALVLADWANEDGTNLYPPIEVIAKKVGLGERATRTAIRRLHIDGILVEVESEGSRSLYRIDVGRLRARDHPGQ